MKASLVLMAAGLGKRYGGCKQLDGVGPNGEILMEYAIHDAVRAGFSKLVFIIKEDMRPWMDEFCRSRLELGVEIKYAVQSMEGAPHGRTKPYGTVHALLCAKPCVAEPFAVINADDYYGPEAFGAAYRGLCDIAGEKGKCVSVPYLLKNTVSPNGTVARAIFENSNGRLTAVRELTKIGLNPDGTIVDTVSGEVLDPDAQVSMNMWCFCPEIFGDLERGFAEFLAATDGGKNNEELPIPVFVNRMLALDRLEILLRPTAGSWFGVTYREDRPAVAEKLAALHRAGVYSARLNGKA
ncbi:MAG: hypothetical protein E7460_01205 [Ruminococcaceae bacterium]|nr:hypothetical protein [Oscillospiraceae bacterium]